VSGFNGGIWKWLAITLAGIVISGVSFTLGYAQIDSRVSDLERAVTRLETQQTAIAERQARDAGDIRDRLSRIENSIERVVTWITSQVVPGRSR
jgi:hypothetical protein